VLHVYLDVFPCTELLKKEVENHCSSALKSSKIIRRIGLITFIPRIFYFSARIVILQRNLPLCDANSSLLLKHHPRFKTKFIRDAKASTTAPDSWAVFLSQRRRWINSTIHNFLVLFSVPGLCGFCCFSMRFIVMLDLISTILQPVVVVYLGYIIYLLASHSDVVPLTSLLILAAIYGLQAVIFILRRRWEMVGYLMIYILAIPIYSFALPLHAFWNMDKFSWYDHCLLY
jgi:Chitin synthase